MKNAWSNGPTGVKPADTTAFIVDLLLRIGQKPQRQRSTVSALRSDTSRYAQVGRAPCKLRGGEPDPLHSFRRGAIRPSYRRQRHVEGNRTIKDDHLLLFRNMPPVANRECPVIFRLLRPKQTGFAVRPG